MAGSVATVESTFAAVLKYEANVPPAEERGRNVAIRQKSRRCSERHMNESKRGKGKGTSGKES